MLRQAQHGFGAQHGLDTQYRFKVFERFVPKESLTIISLPNFLF